MRSGAQVLSRFPQRLISSIKHESKKEGKDQESIQSSTTPDPEY